jgi:hypothetical protein
VTRKLWVAAASVVLAGTTLAAVPAAAALASSPAAVPPAAGLTAAAAAPTAPLLTSVSGTGLGLLADWAPPPSGSGVRGFSVTATPASNAPASCAARTVTAAASNTQALVSGLCSGIVYTATVKARNATATSAASNKSAPVVPLVAQPPGTPLIATVTPRSRSLVVSWVPPADNGGRAITGYRLTAVAGGTTVTVKAGAPATSATLAGLANGTTFAVSLLAVNAVGDSPAATSSGKPAADHAPTAPAGLTVVPNGKGRLVASWAPPADNGGATITGYTLSYRQAALNAATGQWTPVAGRKVVTIKAAAGARTVTTGPFGTSKDFYLFALTAKNAVGTSPAATQQAAVTPVVTTKSKVIVLTAATRGALTGATSSALTWKAPGPAQARKLAAGQTIVAGPGGLLPDGTLRQVVSVSDKSGTLTVATRQGQLSGAFSAMAVDATVNPVSGATAASSLVHAASRTRPVFVPDVAGVRVLQRPAAASADFGDSVSLSVDAKVGHVSVDAEVSLTASIDVSLGVHQGFADVPNGVSVSASAKVTAALDGTVNVDGQWSTQIGEIEGAPIDIQVGPVPVVVVPEVPVFLTASGSTGLGLEVSDTVGGSVAWSSADPAHLAVKNLSSSPVIGGRVVPDVTATGDLALGLQVQPQAGIYDAAGPNVEADLDEDAGINFTGAPFISIGPKVALKAGVDLDLLGKHASLDATIGTFSFAAFTIEDPPTASYTLTPADPAVAAGGTLALTATRSDGVAAPLTWGLIGGTKADSISAAGVLTASGPAGRTLTVTVTDASGATGETTVTVGTAFDAPSNVTATQSAGSAGATVSWTAPADTGGSGLAGYTIVTNPPTSTHTVGATATSVALPALASGTYAVNVYARNTAGEVSAPGTALLNVAGAALTFDHSQSPDAPVAAGAMSCPTASFCLVGGDVYRSGRWLTGPSLPNITLPSVSCTSSTFCMLTYYPETAASPAADAAVFNGTRWSTPVTIDTSTSATSYNGQVTSVSCASTALCMAVDSGGRVLRYNGKSWTKPQALFHWAASKGNALSFSVSCIASGYCLATGAGQWAAYSGGKWSTPASTKQNVAIGSVSCATATFCVGIGLDSVYGGTADGESITFNGHAWSAPKVVNTDGEFNLSGELGSLDDLSCRSTSRCTAIDWYGTSYQFNGASWHRLGRLGSAANAGGFALSCASTSFCAAVGSGPDYADLAATWTPAGWSKTLDLEADFYAISCASQTFCLATGIGSSSQGVAVASVFNGTYWSAPVVVDLTATEPPVVSCPSAKFCMLVTWDGDAITYMNGSWSAPRRVGGGGPFLSVSCPTAEFCMTVDAEGYAYAYHGSGWSGPSLAENLASYDVSYYGGLISVSCPTAAFCLAVDVYGHSVTYRSGKWSATPVTVPGVGAINSVSCSSVTFCLAAGTTTDEDAAPVATAEYNGASWSAGQQPTTSGGLPEIDVSCPSAGFCGLGGLAQTNGFGDAPQVRENGAWSETFMPSNGAGDAISCTADDWCATIQWPTRILWSDAA